jgi:hypothetical protein
MKFLIDVYDFCAAVVGGQNGVGAGACPFSSLIKHLCMVANTDTSVLLPYRLATLSPNPKFLPLVSTALSNLQLRPSLFFSLSNPLVKKSLFKANLRPTSFQRTQRQHCNL